MYKYKICITVLKMVVKKIKSVQFLHNSIKYNIPIISAGANISEAIATWLKFNKFGVKYIIGAIQNCKYCKYAQDLLDVQNINYIALYPCSYYHKCIDNDMGAPGAMLSLFLTVSGHLMAKSKNYTLQTYDSTLVINFFKKLLDDNGFINKSQLKYKLMRYKRELSAILLRAKSQNYAKTWPFILGVNGYILGGFETLHKEYLKTQNIIS